MEKSEAAVGHQEGVIESAPDAPLTAAIASKVQSEPVLPQTRGTEIPPAAKVAASTPIADAAKPSPAGREIQLQFGSDGARVQIRLAERAGEVRVAVHTPDANLAGALREDLPVLTAKLEQAGFRAEGWHGVPTGPPEAGRAAEPAAGIPRQDTPDSRGRESGRQQDEQQQQQRQQPPKDPAAGKPSETDFSWLFESLR